MTTTQSSGSNKTFQQRHNELADQTATLKQRQVSKLCGFIAVTTLILWFTGFLVMLGIDQYTTHAITANYFIAWIVAGGVVLYTLNLIDQVYGTGKI